VDLDQEPPKRLEYRSPDLNPRAISGWQVVGGLIMAPVILVASTMLGGFLGSAADRRSGDTVAVCALLGVFAGFGLIAWWAVSAGRYEYRRGLALGLWIGGGLIILLTGACFIAAWR